MQFIKITKIVFSLTLLLNSEQKSFATYGAKKILEKNEVNFLVTLPIKDGGLDYAGKEIQRGLALVFNSVNKQGGLNDKYLVKLNCKDDENNPLITQKIVEKEAVSFLSLFGTDSLVATWDLLAQKKLFLFCPFAGGLVYRKKQNSNTWFFRATIQKEIESLLDFAIKEKRERIAIFYEDSEFGKEGMLYAEELLKTAKSLNPNINLVAKSFYPQNTVSIMKAVDEIVPKMPQAILFIAHYFPVYNFIQQALKAKDPLPGGTKGCLFLGINTLTPYQQVIRKSYGRLILSSVVPNPHKSNYEIVRKYRQEMKNNEATSLSLEAFIVGSIFAEVTKDISGESSFDDINKKIKALKPSFGEIPLDPDFENKTLCTNIWINDDIEKDWVIYNQSSSIWSSAKKIAKQDLDREANA